MSTTNGPSIIVCRLWRRPGYRGRPDTFTGVWGGARVAVVVNETRRDDDDAEYLLTFSQRPEETKL